MRRLLGEGKLKVAEHAYKEGGLADAPRAFVDMMSGANLGKTVVWCEQQ